MTPSTGLTVCWAVNAVAVEMVCVEAVGVGAIDESAEEAFRALSIL